MTKNMTLLYKLEQNKKYDRKPKNIRNMTFMT